MAQASSPPPKLLLVSLFLLEKLVNVDLLELLNSLSIFSLSIDRSVIVC